MLAFHGIFGAYGFWLPNDPRGSWSEWVGSWELYRYGRSTKTNARHSLAYKQHNHQQRQAAKNALRYKPVRFTGKQAQAVAIGLRQAIEEHRFTCYGCAIMPDHIHLAIRCTTMSPGLAIGKLKRHAGNELTKRHIHPLQSHAAEHQHPPMCFARRAWKVFLNSEDDLRRSIDYVRLNPIKEGLKPQRWSFVTTPPIS